MHEKKYKNNEKINFTPLRSLDLGKVKNFDGLTRAMSLTAFQGRNLGEAVDVLEAMVKDKDCFKVLTLSGAMTMAKMGLVITDMIDHNMVNAIVSTGALLSHGFVEGIGMTHFKNPGNVSDEKLRTMRLDRVYDTLESEKNLDEAELIVKEVLEGFDPNRPVCSHEIIYKLGEYLDNHVKGRSLFKSAYKKKIPIYIPAFTDCELGLDFALFNRRQKLENKKQLQFDAFLDLEHYTEKIFKAKKTGIFTIGGGVPRNWAQQVGPYLDITYLRIIAKGDMKKYFAQSKDSPYNKKFSYGVRICPEPVHWGGLSGCTYSEGVSWGKFVPEAEGGRYAEVLVDATVAWPIVVKAVLERLGKR